MDEKMNAAMEEFISRRINDHGRDEPEALSEEYERFTASIEALKAAVLEERRSLFNDLVNSYSLLEGETMRYYYRAGFADAVSFLTGWRDRAWN